MYYDQLTHKAQVGTSTECRSCSHLFSMWLENVQTSLCCPEHMNTQCVNACIHAQKSPLITLPCGLWVSTDKQCDDQRAAIALRWKGVGRTCAALSWEKEWTVQYIRKKNRYGVWEKRIKSKASHGSQPGYSFPQIWHKFRTSLPSITVSLQLGENWQNEYTTSDLFHIHTGKNLTGRMWSKTC